MDKAIEIRRQAQRSIQNGDLDGALAAYERLIAADDSDPYNFILMADLLFKKGHAESAAKRYLTAIDCYEKSALYKNAIAVGKKMMRLGLSPSGALERLGRLHVLDGLGSEGTLYYAQAGELRVNEGKPAEAAVALRSAFNAFPENIKALERIGEVLSTSDPPGSSRAFAEAAFYYEQAGRAADAERCRASAEAAQPGAVAQFDAQAPPPPAPRNDASVAASRQASPPDPAQSGGSAPEPGSVDLSAGGAPPPAGSTPAPPPARLELDTPTSNAPAEVGATASSAPEATAIPEPAAPASPVVSAAPAAGASPANADDEMPTDLKGVERLLATAQKEFRAGNRERAAEILARAAQAFESFGRLDNAASIYRSLCSGPHATRVTLELWLRNCERREDRREAGTVACELGDRAIQENKLELAREWFERARAYDSNNLVARRRLDRLQPGSEPAPAAAKPAPPPPPEPEPIGSSDGKVQIGADRGQAVHFDFDATLAEFQKGVESQLSGDAQGHYDLAMAYREMGLSKQAIESFRFAATDPTFKSRAAEMIGHCLLEEGRIDDAARELTEALADPELDALGSVGIRFQLGLALEASGQLQDALHQFEQVFAVQASHRDVAQKIRVLRKDLDEAA